MLKFFLISAVLVGGISTAAFAQHSGTDKEQQACARDVSKFCRKVMDQGDFTVLACLKENRPKISAACNAVLVSHGQ
jgi:hypothetical protein